LAVAQGSLLALSQPAKKKGAVGIKTLSAHRMNRETGHAKIYISAIIHKGLISVPLSTYSQLYETEIRNESTGLTFPPMGLENKLREHLKSC